MVFQRVRTWWRLRRAHLFLHAWGLCIGALALVTSVTYFINPEYLLRLSSVGLQLKQWAYIWNALYGVGGLQMLLGTIWMRRDLNAMGLALLAGAILIQAIAILSVAFTWIAALTSIFLFIATLARLYAVLKSELV